MIYKSIDFFKSLKYKNQIPLRNKLSQLLLIFPAYFYKKINETNENLHICLRPSEIFNFIWMCKLISPKIVSKFQTQLMSYKDKIQCERCSKTLSIDYNLICMQKCIINESPAVKQTEPVQKYNIKQKFDQINHILSSPESQTIFSRTQKLFLILRSFRLLLLFCSLKEQFQQKYKGIYNYFHTCILKNNFFNYFNNADPSNIIIFSTLQTLEKYYPEDYIYFLFKLTEVVQFKCLSKYSVDIYSILRVYLSYHHEDTLITTYLKIAHFKKKQPKRYPNIAIVYNVIFNRVKNPIYKQKIAVSILGLIDYMEIFWARESRICLLDYQIQKAKNDKRKQRKLNYLIKKYIFRVIDARGQPYTIKRRKRELSRKLAPKQLLKWSLITLNKNISVGITK